MAIIFNPTDREIEIKYDGMPIIFKSKAKREFTPGESKFIADFYKDTGLVELTYEDFESQEHLIEKELQGLRNQIVGMKKRIDSFNKDLKLQAKLEGMESLYKPEYMEEAEEELNRLEINFKNKKKVIAKPVEAKAETKPNIVEDDITIPSLVCDICGFEAKSIAGLSAHKSAKHKVDEPSNDNNEG